MSHQAAPTSDAVLLVYLLSVLLFMAMASMIVYQVTRPTILPNAGIAAFEREKRLPVILPPTPWRDVEKSTLEAAAHENELQGLLPVTVADQSQSRPVPTVATVMVARPRAKRVAKVQVRNRVPDGRDAWAFAPHGRPFSSSDRFGSWFR